MNRLASGLTALLDALEQDLLAAPADELRDALARTGRARDLACREVRALLDEAIAASEDGSALMAPPKARAKAGMHRH